jgi:hypothetical protein
MLSDAAVANGIAEAEKRIDAMEVLCEILAGQIKGERRQLDEVKEAIACTLQGRKEALEPPGEIAPDMLGS